MVGVQCRLADINPPWPPKARSVPGTPAVQRRAPAKAQVWWGSPEAHDDPDTPGHEVLMFHVKH